MTNYHSEATLYLNMFAPYFDVINGLQSFKCRLYYNPITFQLFKY